MTIKLLESLKERTQGEDRPTRRGPKERTDQQGEDTRRGQTNKETNKERNQGEDRPKTYCVGILW
jgi:hypothetical protein